MFAVRLLKISAWLRLRGVSRGEVIAGAEGTSREYNRAVQSAIVSAVKNFEFRGPIG